MLDVLLTLARLACPVAMGVMMWMMMRDRRRDAPPAAAPGDPGPTEAAPGTGHVRLGTDRLASITGSHDVAVTNYPPSQDVS